MVISIVSVFLAEDDQQVRELLVDYIISRSELKLEDIAYNGKEALEKISGSNFDIVIPGVNLLRLSGINLIEKLTYDPHIIFTASSDSYTLKAFEIGIIDYLVKPFTRIRFKNAIDRALKIIVSSGNSILPVSPLEFSFKEKCTRLPSSEFLRIYKQYIVNLRKISHLHYDIGGQYFLYLTDDETTNLPVGIKYSSC